MNEDQVKLKVAEALSGLRPDQRDRVLKRVKAQVDTNVLIQRRSEVQRQLVSKQAEKIKTEEQIRALDELIPWTDLPNHKLERNDCSRLHKLAEALMTGKVMNEDGTLLDEDRPATVAIWANAQPFVVQNDWAAAFEGATDYIDGEFRLPYTHCAFEFRISGRTVIVVAFQVDPSIATDKVPGPQLGLPYVECSGGYWFFGGEKAREDPVFQYAWKQIRAISVALDAEVAEHDVVRADTPLNARRTKEGKIPLYDFHVVKLHGRQQHRPGAMGGTHRSPRLHFRRGHWRHYEAHKTWIRWMLVGNPELGFIDKTYRL